MRQGSSKDTNMTTFVQSACHCGRNVFKVAFTTASLPLSNNMCHCNTCRHCTGQMFQNYVSFDGEPMSADTPFDFKDLTPYKTSVPMTRWFCSTCSTHLLAKHTQLPAWNIAVGTLEKAEGIVTTHNHIWVGNTLDGGISDNLHIIDGLEIPRYSGFPSPDGKLPTGWRSDTLVGGTDHNQLLAHCHCNSITFSITRPSAASALPKSPYPDFLKLYHSTPASQIQNPEDEKWWLRSTGPEGPSRYLAGFCACQTCRRVPGSEAQPWAFIPRYNITFQTGLPNDRSNDCDLRDESKRPKELKQYESSPGRYREFCGKCGANVFFWNSATPDLIAVSAGLFDESAGGARADGWLEWHKGRAAFAEEAVRKAVVAGMAD